MVGDSGHGDGAAGGLGLSIRQVMVQCAVRAACQMAGDSCVAALVCHEQQQGLSGHQPPIQGRSVSVRYKETPRGPANPM
jgi:hypothetical protein